MLRYKTDRTWFSCLVRHPARKWSRYWGYVDFCFFANWPIFLEITPG